MYLEQGVTTAPVLSTSCAKVQRLTSRFCDDEASFKMSSKMGSKSLTYFPMRVPPTCAKSPMTRQKKLLKFNKCILAHCILAEKIEHHGGYNQMPAHIIRMLFFLSNERSKRIFIPMALKTLVITIGLVSVSFNFGIKTLTIGST